MPHLDEKTETYLLTNKGLEKLDVSKEIVGAKDKQEPDSKRNLESSPKGAKSLRSKGNDGKSQMDNKSAVVVYRRNSRSRSERMNDSHNEVNKRFSRNPRLRTKIQAGMFP